MIISREQYAQFEQHAWNDFMRRAVAHLRQDMADYIIGFSDEQLRDRIEYTADLADKYGLDTEQDVICLLNAGLVLNDSNFPDNPHYLIIRSVLKDEDMVPEERARQALVLAFQLKLRT